MNDLVSKLEELKESDVGNIIRKRMEEFKDLGRQGNERWFSELSFCILTANSSAQLGVDIQDELGTKGFLELPRPELKTKLRDLGHRFYRTRADYIVEAREYSGTIKDVVTGFSHPREARDWLVGNVKGIGYKEGSHFLRNVGYDCLAILDRHVLRILNEWGVIKSIPSTLTKRRYKRIEGELGRVAEGAGLTLGEMDLYLWYMDTGLVLK